MYYVCPKHGEPLAHDGMVSALLDILDTYVNESTGILIWEDQPTPEDAIVWFPAGARLIKGPEESRIK